MGINIADSVSEDISDKLQLRNFHRIRKISDGELDKYIKKKSFFGVFKKSIQNLNQFYEFFVFEQFFNFFRNLIQEFIFADKINYFYCFVEDQSFEKKQNCPRFLEEMLEFQLKDGKQLDKTVLMNLDISYPYVKTGDLIETFT